MNPPKVEFVSPGPVEFLQSRPTGLQSPMLRGLLPMPDLQLREPDEARNFHFHFIVIHTVKGFGIVSKAKVDVFFWNTCSFDDPEDVGNLISGSSAFSKTSLKVW